MSTVITYPSVQDAAAAFGEAFRSAEDAFVAAGRIYAEAIRQFGQGAREAFASAAPKISASTWRRLEAIGNGALDSRLLTAGSAGAAALRRLPVQAQGPALDHGVEVLIGSGDTLRIQIDNLTQQQVRQVFSGDHIRDIPAQRAWLETNAPHLSSPSIAAGSPWIVKAGKVSVSRPCQLTRLDLVRMLAEIG